MKSRILLAAASILTCSFGVAAEKRPGWVDRELEKIRESARFDFPAYTQWFYLRSVFAEHPEGEAIGEGVNQQYQDLVDAIAAEGMDGWGLEFSGQLDGSPASRQPRCRLDRANYHVQLHPFI